MAKYDYKGMMRGIESACISKVIDEYVHSSRDRKIIKLSLIHNISYTRIPEKMDSWISPKTVQNVMNKWMPEIIEHIKR